MDRIGQPNDSRMAGHDGFGLTRTQFARICQFLGIGLNGVEIGDLFRATNGGID